MENTLEKDKSKDTSIAKGVGFRSDLGYIEVKRFEVKDHTELKECSKK